MFARASLCLAISLINLGAVNAAAQSDTIAAEIKISAAISSPSVSLGDTLTYSITFLWPGEQGRVLIEEFSPPATENLHILGTKAELSFYQENQKTYSKKEFFFYFSADSIGTAGLHPLTVNYYDTQTDKADSYTSPTYGLTITASSPAGRRFVWFLAAAAILLGLGYIFRLYRKLKEPTSELPPSLSLEEQTLTELEAITVPDLGNALNQLQKIVFNYLELRFNLNLAGKTTAEALENLNQPEGESRQLLEEVLKTIEQARFDPEFRESLTLEETITKFRRVVELQQSQPVK